MSIVRKVFMVNSKLDREYVQDMGLDPLHLVGFLCRRTTIAERMEGSDEHIMVNGPCKGQQFSFLSEEQSEIRGDVCMQQQTGE